MNLSIMTSNKDSFHQGCKLCGGNTFVAKYIYKNCEVVRCNSCGLVQVKEEPNTAEIYTEEYFDHDKLCGPANKLEQKRRLHWLTKCGLKHGMRLLDAGCASGEFLVMANQFYNVRGIDISKYAIKQALRNYPSLKGKLKASRLEDVAFDTSTFDAIVMWDVIEHLHNPQKVILKLTNFLKPAGFFFISTPNIGTLTAKLLGRWWAFMTPPEHQCFFTPMTLSRLMSECGLEKIMEMNRGKWVNMRFLLYKVQRVFPGSMIKILAQMMMRMIPEKSMIYAPSGDVLYNGFRLRNDL